MNDQITTLPTKNKQWSDSYQVCCSQVSLSLLQIHQEHKVVSGELCNYLGKFAQQHIMQQGSQRRALKLHGPICTTKYHA
jgi:hypothetical protein